MNIPSISTPRLLLRPWTLEDGEAWFNILQEPDILRYFPNPNPPRGSKPMPTSSTTSRTGCTTAMDIGRSSRPRMAG